MDDTVDVLRAYGFEGRVCWNKTAIAPQGEHEDLLIEALRGVGLVGMLKLRWYQARVCSALYEVLVPKRRYGLGEVFMLLELAFSS